MLKKFMQMDLPVSRKMKYSILKRVRSHDKGAFEIDFTYCGVQIPINMFDGTQRSIYLYDGDEKFMLNFLRDYYAMLPKGGVFLDIGANSGNHAIWMSQYADKVYAFEPQKRLHERLRNILRENSEVGNIEVCPFALGEENKTDYIYHISKYSGSSSIVRKPDTNVPREEISIRQGDEAIRELNPESIAAVKIDVEGYEHFVLKGIGETLEKYRPLVIFEHAEENKASYGSFEGMRELFPEGYEFYQFDRRGAYRYHNCRRGFYTVVDFDFDLPVRAVATGGNANIIACPAGTEMPKKNFTPWSFEIRK
ncbi:conserved protein of unknown function [Pseudodesulfovibrio profundus]|uniref:Methyltransferase FkbM domain-containing protein n=1 Tax=Pseudodesulfovibrio profundus TaxID=57320 RepID=A0A2C8FB59_9BACT|nr:FkbM family methyltransferase [Pseudodesulfovibrio profundus]SOB59876.1 conserved protein of unknown function [Pseudodesulfovibrio profundus]